MHGSPYHQPLPSVGALYKVTNDMDSREPQTPPKLINAYFTSSSKSFSMIASSSNSSLLMMLQEMTEFPP